MPLQKENRELSKLEKITKDLSSNPDVSVIGAFEKNYFPEKGGQYSHFIEFYVAPKKGLYTLNEMQNFLDNLVPKIKPTSKHNFKEDNYSIQFGWLYFEEIIGKERIIKKRIITLNDPKLLNSFNIDFAEISKKVRMYKNGKIKSERAINTDITQNLKRHIKIDIYPNEEFARKIAGDPNLRDSDEYCANHISLSELNRLKVKK